MKVIILISAIFLERFYGGPAKTVAALDLGGGSTQVTFSALTPASLSQKAQIHSAVSPSGIIPVFTHSYLGLGLMAARKEVLTLNQPNQINVTSLCVNHIIKDKKFHFGGTDYFISGPQENYPTISQHDQSYKVGQKTPIVNFDECAKIVTGYVVSKAKPLDELPTKIIFAFSYYFDRAIEVGLIDESTGGSIAVEDFKKAAKEGKRLVNIFLEHQSHVRADRLTF